MGVFRRADCWLAGLVSGLSAFWASVITTVPFSAVWSGKGVSGYCPLFPVAFSAYAVFCQRDELDGDVTGFSGGNCVGVISEYGGQKLSEATTNATGIKSYSKMIIYL